MRSDKLRGVLSFFIITAANINLYKKVVVKVEKENEKEAKVIEHELAQELEKIIYNIYICQKKIILQLRQTNLNT